MNFLKNIPEIEKKIGYTFKDKSLVTQAFTRSSFCNEHRISGKRPMVSNEVLEFFGDSVLSTAIISLMLKEKTERYEFGIYTELDEGNFSNIRSKLSDKRNLSHSMSTLGLQKYLLMGEGDGKLGIENEPSVMEDLFESIIGAVYIDCGMDISKVIKVVSKILDTSVYFSAEAAPIQSYKNALQEWCADKKHRLPAPVYKTVSESGPDHKRVYERAVIIGERVVATGQGKNQKIADSAAAEAALEILKRENIASREVNLEGITKLKAYAAKNKQPSPEFRDLGETPRSTPATREYAIECRLMGKSEIGIGNSKQEARAKAAEKLLNLLTEKDAPAKHPKKKKAPIVEKKQPKQKPVANNVRKSNRSSSPKKPGFQHKKHL
jgi:ribonuclease-3